MPPAVRRYLAILARYRLPLLIAVLGLVIGVQLAERDLLRVPPQEILTDTLQNLLGPEPLRSPDDSLLATGGCLCPSMGLICPCGSTSRRALYEPLLWAQIEQLAPPMPASLQPDFLERLRAATGYANATPSPASAGGKAVQTQPYLGGTATDIHYAYDRPHATMRAVFARHETPAPDLIVVLHGMWSSASRVLGLGDEDYLHRIGERMFRRGLDVLAFDLPSNGTLSTWLNLAWQDEGVQLFGLWVDAICRAKDALAAQYGYRRIFLYGLSNGGRTVEYTATLCPGFDAAVVDDNWIPRNDFALERTVEQVSNLKLLFWVDHLTPGLLDTSLRDFVAGAQSPIFYTIRRREIEAMTAALAPAFQIGGPVSAATRRGILVKRIDSHVPEEALLDALIDGKWPELEGFSLTAATP
ncbi:MAG: alpha/beta hydrolase [Alphaproteobacteria bacterium]